MSDRWPASSDGLGLRALCEFGEQEPGWVGSSKLKGLGNETSCQDWSGKAGILSPCGGGGEVVGPEW